LAKILSGSPIFPAANLYDCFTEFNSQVAEEESEMIGRGKAAMPPPPYGGVSPPEPPTA